jgi:hypothetical protein
VYLKHDEGMSTDSDHMEKDFILALEAIRRKCSLSSGDRAHVEEQLRRHLFGWAYSAYDANDYHTLRERLRWSFELGQGGAREAAFLMASYLPSPVLSLLRSTKRAFARAE